MKSTKIISLSAATLVMLGLGTSTTFAAENEFPKSDVEVNIIDGDTNPEDPDPIPTDPENPVTPGNGHLELVKVPSKYSFTSTLKNDKYVISNGNAQIGVDENDRTIDVFNDRMDREWEVRAVVKDQKLTKDESEFTVDSFKVNNNEIGTGVEAVVAKATSFDETNTGTIKTLVDNIAISFSDPEGVLKANDKLSGIINYNLYKTGNHDK